MEIYEQPAETWKQVVEWAKLGRNFNVIAGDGYRKRPASFLASLREEWKDLVKGQPFPEYIQCVAPDDGPKGDYSSYNNIVRIISSPQSNKEAKILLIGR